MPRLPIFFGTLAIFALLALVATAFQAEGNKAEAGGGGNGTLFLRSRGGGTYPSPWLSFQQWTEPFNRAETLWNEHTTLHFRASGLTGTYDPYRALEPHILVDTLGPEPGNVVQVVMVFDYEGDGNTDASVRIDAFDLDNQQGWQKVKAEPFRLSSWGGEFRDFNNGTIEIQAWLPVSKSAVIIRTDFEGSYLVLPYDFTSGTTPTATQTNCQPVYGGGSNCQVTATPTPWPTCNPAFQSGYNCTMASATPTTTSCITAQGGGNPCGTPMPTPVTCLSASGGGPDPLCPTATATSTSNATNTPTRTPTATATSGWTFAFPQTYLPALMRGASRPGAW